ncbi:MAG: class I SAM-dependent methyltransferase [Acidobacteriota bacterium]
MRIQAVGDNPVERLLLALDLLPVSLLDTHGSFMRGRAIMVGVKLGVFDALAAAPLAAAQVAERCGTHAGATEKLLNALVGSGYLSFARDRYALRRVARRWLVGDAPHSLRDKVLFEFVEWRLTERFEDFVRSGKPEDLHRSVSAEDWGLYQRAMRALSGLAAPELARRTPMPKQATRMLDIGGAHGYQSVALCRRYPGLSAVVLDLPAAIEHSAPILAREGMGERVVHQAGDVLSTDLGVEAWDFVLISQLLHHFDESTNRDITRRVARSLRPGGAFAILEIVRPGTPGALGQAGALLDLYFAVTSQSGTWSIPEMSGWQRDAGLLPRPPIRLRTLPGAAQVVAVKPG